MENITLKQWQEKWKKGEIKSGYIKVSATFGYLNDMFEFFSCDTDWWIHSRYVSYSCTPDTKVFIAGN